MNKVTLGDTSVGVPVIAQVAVLKDKPVGSVDGVMAQLVMGEDPVPQLMGLAMIAAALPV